MISKSSWKANSRSAGKKIKFNRIPVLSFLNLITSAPVLNVNDVTKTLGDTSCSWLRISTGTQRRSSQHVSVQMWGGAQAPSANRDFLTAPSVFPSSTDCTRETKVKRQINQHTLGLEGETADWSCDLTCQWKNARLVTICLETPSEKKIQVPLFQKASFKGLHSFCVFNSASDYKYEKKNWFCHQVSNFVGLLFPLKQMIAANRAKPA